MKYDFSGWATRNDLRCSDGRTIRRDAFKGNDGQVVPLVWNHQHNEPFNILGHALLENRNEGVYAYCSFNDSEAGKSAKELVNHGDVSALSIYANQLKQNGGDVLHGAIREVSIVLAGANPGAFIDSVISHGEASEEEGIIYTGFNIETLNDVKHAEECANKGACENKESEGSKEETVQDVFNTLSDKQKEVAYALIGLALSNDDEEDSEEEPEDTEEPVKHAEEGSETIKDIFETFTEKQKQAVYAIIGAALEEEKNKGDNTNMKHNAFENENAVEDTEVLTHSEMESIFADVKRYGSLKESALQHGINNISYLFPDAQQVSKTPEWLTEDDAWVSVVMNGTHHTPFSRVKSSYADITEADARAKGYIKGNQKVEEFFSVLKRTTEPQTIYKKQKLDRDDVIDITDFDVVAWVKGEMRMKLNEEIARAVLVSDGRSSSSDDKINESHIRPIWTDDDVYTIKSTINVTSSMTADQKAHAFIRAAVKSRKDYKGSGNPVLFTTEDMLTDMLLMEDTQGRVIYDSESKLATALRVSRIVTVPCMENLSRIVSGTTRYLAGIIVNLADYNIGADKGGAVNMFDDFDIDYNAQKYLIETRCSGALVKPYSAIALELVFNLSSTVSPESAGTTILGKTVSDLQTNVVVNGDSIQGKLKYVTGYTQFSGDEAEQSGNYLALKFTHTAGATTTIQLLGGDHPERVVALDSDMNAVIRVTDKDSNVLRVTTTKDGQSLVKDFDLTLLRVANA